MSAVLVKGIIISVSIAVAFGIALQSPEVKTWVEEQRRKLAEFLRSMSEDLDPQTRREAEAFAYEGRMPTPREQQGMQDATAVATGSDTTGTDALRRSTRQSSSANAADAAERRRLGREYLARRNQELLDLKEKQKSGMIEYTTEKRTDDGETKVAADDKRMTMGSFETLVDEDGTLRIDEKRALHLPAVPSHEPSFSAPPVPAAPIAISGLTRGALFGNPFGDEYAMSDAMEESETPRPPVPPKIALRDSTVASSPSNVEHRNVRDERSTQQEEMESEPRDLPSNLSYDEQLARALSLSLADSEEATRRRRQRSTSEEAELARAIAESLKVPESRPATEPLEQVDSDRGPLVDFSGDALTDTADRQAAFHPANPWVRSDDEDLYFLTPHSTGARILAESVAPSIPPQPLSSAAQEAPLRPGDRGALESPSSYTLSPGLLPVSPTTLTLSPSIPPSHPAEDAMSTGFSTESETEDFASVAGSMAPTEGSGIDVVIEDVDSMSESDDDGIRTPQSWSEVGSEVGDMSESSASERSAVRI